MREHPEFFNDELWKQRTENGHPPKDLHHEQLTKHRYRVYLARSLPVNTPITPVAGSVILTAVVGTYSYPAFPYIPAPFFRSANPYFPPPPGYYSGYSPMVDYYCLPYPQTHTPLLPSYGSTPRRAPISVEDGVGEVGHPTNHSSLIDLASSFQYNKPGKNMRLELGVNRDGSPKNTSQVQSTTSAPSVATTHFRSPSPTQVIDSETKQPSSPSSFASTGLPKRTKFSKKERLRKDLTRGGYPKTASPKEPHEEVA
jgi:hypothetical protein